MKVVHVVRQYPPAVGGLEEAVSKLCRALAEREGIRVAVVTLDRLFGEPGRRLPARECLDGIEVRRIGYAGSRRYPLAPAVLAQLRDADVVHVHAIDFFFDFLAATRALHRRPLVASTHGGFFHTDFARSLKTLFFTSVTRRSARAYRAICASSEADGVTFRRIAGERVVVIENGVDIEKWRDRASPTPRPAMIFIGRFSANKRLETLFPLLAALRARAPDWRLIVAGRPWDLGGEDLRRLAAEHGVAEATTILLEPSTEAIAAALRAASYVISPSAYEGFGLSVVEGLSAGLLPLLSPIPPFAKLLREAGVGAAIDPADPAGAAAAILRHHEALQRDPAAPRARAIAAAGRYGWPAAAAAFAAQYRAAARVADRN